MLLPPPFKGVQKLALMTNIVTDLFTRYLEKGQMTSLWASFWPATVVQILLFVAKERNIM